MQKVFWNNIADMLQIFRFIVDIPFKKNPIN